MNTGIVGARHVKVDVDGVGVEAGGVPFYVKLLASDDVLVHGRRFVEAASLAGYGIGGQMGSEGEMKTVVLTRVGGPFPADMAYSEVRGVGGHYSRKIRDGGENERIPRKGGGLVNDCGLTEGRGREEKPWEDEKGGRPRHQPGSERRALATERIREGTLVKSYLVFAFCDIPRPD